MLIIKKPDDKILKQVAKRLRAGAIVVYPTDTAYALGCDATNVRTVENIFKIKGRDGGKALPMICSDAKMVKKFFAPTGGELKLVDRHWPGPLTVVVKAKKGVAKNAISDGTAAVRVPDSTIARTLSKYLKRPLVATSANVSGQPACYSVIAFMRQFATDPFPALGQEAVAVDAGALRRRKSSTIVKVAESGKMEILRKGPVKL